MKSIRVEHPNTPDQYANVQEVDSRVVVQFCRRYLWQDGKPAPRLISTKSFNWPLHVVLDHVHDVLAKGKQ